MMGLNDVLPPMRLASLEAGLKGRKGRWDVIRVQLRTEQGRGIASRLDSQLTSHFLNMGNCDGLVLLGGEVESVSAGTSVEILEFGSQF